MLTVKPSSQLRSDETWEGDARRNGPNDAQRALVAMLHRWAMATWPAIGGGRGKTLAMRIAEADCAGPDPDPREIQIGRRRLVRKLTTRGKEKRRTEGPDSESPQFRTLNRLLADLMLENPGQYALVCIHYNAWTHRDSLGWSPSEKARELGLSDKTYQNRLSRFRSWILENWPTKVTLA